MNWYKAAQEAEVIDPKNGSDIFAPKNKVDPTSTSEFKAWFGEYPPLGSSKEPMKPGGSVAVDENGKPRVFYHGTNADFTSFETGREGSRSGTFGSWKSRAHALFFTKSPEIAYGFASQHGEKGARTMPVYLNVRQPLDLQWGVPNDVIEELTKLGMNYRWLNQFGPMDAWELFEGEDGKMFVDAIQKLGYDGAIINEPGDHNTMDSTSWVVFSPSQVKSALGNTGQFSPQNPNIMASSRNWHKKSNTGPMNINAINDLFDRDVADAQRGEPEAAMLAVQRAMGGGVLNFVIEHVGDLTHRMAEKVTANTGGYQYVEEKIRRALRFLNQGYGFDREFRENVQNNARAKNIPEQQLMAQIDAALQAYAAAHQQIPVYNEVQRLARDAAVSLGYRQWNRASTFLMQLQNYLNEGIEAWTARSREYQGQRPQEKVAQYESDFSYLEIGHDTGQEVILWGHDGKKIFQREIVNDQVTEYGISQTDHTSIFSLSENRSLLAWGRIEKATKSGSISYRPSLENGTYMGVLRNNDKIIKNIYLDVVRTFPDITFTWYGVYGSKPANSILKVASSAPEDLSSGPEDFGFGQQEELDPELKRYLTLGPHFTALQHPLVYSVPYFPQLNAMLNKQLRAKKEIIAKEEAAGDYHQAMWLHERPHRLNYFARIADRLSDEDYWKTLGTAYVDSENIWQNAPLVRHLLSNPYRQHSRQMIMDEDDLAKYNTLPEIFKVYRGCIAKNKNGMSWTLDPGKAEWFAKRLSKKNPIVITGIVNKADVIAYFGGREEQEIVVNPRSVKNKQERKLL